jgi:hypothetical protein
MAHRDALTFAADAAGGPDLRYLFKAGPVRVAFSFSALPLQRRRQFMDSTLLSPPTSAAGASIAAPAGRQGTIIDSGRRALISMLEID